METEYESITKYKKWVRGKPQKSVSHRRAASNRHSIF